MTQAEVSLARFAGRVAVVTGSASGIGQAAAIRLASEGARVACLDVNLSGAQQTAESIAASGGEAVGYACDVSDPDQVTAVAQTIVEEFGDPNIVCNIAGVVSSAPIEELTLEEWRRVVDINLTGTFLVCQAFLPALVRTRGCIVNTGSRLGVQGRPHRAAYGASKAGVHLLTKSLAMEFVDRGVRVNAVLPGATRTGIAKAAWEKSPSAPRTVAHSPLGMAEPEEIAAAIAFIASDEMRFMTGSIVPVDGGVTA